MPLVVSILLPSPSSPSPSPSLSYHQSLPFFSQRKKKKKKAMYPSSQGSMGPNGGIKSSGLIRYGSAPSSLLGAAVDSVINPASEFSATGSSHHFQMGPTSSSSSRFFPSSETSSHTSESTREKGRNISSSGLQTIDGGGGAGMISSSSTTAAASPLVRHSSSPAGFLSHLAHACTSNEDNNRFSIARGHGISRLNSQLSFTRQETLSQISEGSENVDNCLNAENDKRKSTHACNTASYGVGSWEDDNTIMFSMGPSKRPKNMNGDIVSLNSMETQFQFSMPQTMLDVSSMDNLLNIPQHSVPCKIRAKRGCATHPRSIAERERRTRISGKLKKLQDLVPNMDKQTSYADMLDLAVQHIKGLQNQVQKLKKEQENCTRGCRKPQNPYRVEKS